MSSLDFYISVVDSSDVNSFFKVLPAITVVFVFVFFFLPEGSASTAVSS